MEKVVSNVTGKRGREFSPSELLKLSDDARERKAPEWVARELENQALSQLPIVRE